jgi:hypothetical protein
VSTSNVSDPGNKLVHINSAGDVLQASTTVASLAVALVALLHTTSLAKLIVLSIGNFGLPLGYAVLFCGLLALAASISSLSLIIHETGVSLGFLIMHRSNLSWLFMALVLFTLIYVGIATTY